MSRQNFVNVLTLLDVEGDLPFEVIPGHFLDITITITDSPTVSVYTLALVHDAGPYWRGTPNKRRSRALIQILTSGVTLFEFILSRQEHLVVRAYRGLQKTLLQKPIVRFKRVPMLPHV